MPFKKSDARTVRVFALSFPFAAFMAAACVFTTLAATSAHAASRAERLEAGEVIISSTKVEGFDIPRVFVEAIIKAPPDKVWKLIGHCGTYSKTMPRIAKSAELSRKGGDIKCDITVDLPFPLSDIQSVTTVKHTKKSGVYVRKWKLLRGDYERNEGSWTVAPYGKNQTRVKYEVFAVPNLPFPGFLQEMAQNSSLPKMIKKIRAQTEG